MSLDELQELAVKHFSDIPNNQLLPIDFSAYTHENAYTERFYKNAFFVKPIENEIFIDITWCLPPLMEVKIIILNFSSLFELISCCLMCRNTKVHQRNILIF